MTDDADRNNESPEVEWWEECSYCDISTDTCDASEPQGDECDICPVGMKLYQEDS
jgi:hypothetical protein